MKKMMLRFKAKTLSILLVALLAFGCVPAIALAGTTNPPAVSAGRISLDMPQGIVYSSTITDGFIDITINASDWQTASNESFIGLILMYINVSAPDNSAIKKCSIIAGDGQGLIDNMDTYFDEEPRRELMTASHDLMLAQIKETSSGVVSVPNDTAGYMLIVRWYDEDNNVLVTEMLTCNLHHAELKATHIVRPVPSSARVILNANNLDGINCNYNAAIGSIYYTAMDKVLLQAAIADGNPNIETRIIAPAGATKYNWDGMPGTNPIVDGYVGLWLDISSGGNVRNSFTTYGEKIYWYNEENSLILEETYDLGFVNATDGTWAEVDDRWSAIPADRIIADESIAASGIAPTIQPGMIHISFDANSLPRLDLIVRSQFNITCPEGAAFYKEVGMGGPMYASFMADEGAYYLNISDLQTIGADGYVGYEVQFANVTLVGDGLITVYYSLENPIGYAASALLINWYDANGDFLKGEYVMCVIDRFSYLVETPAISDLDALEDPVENPTIVGDEQWKLVTEYNPQSAESAVLYELSLRDGSDRFVNNTDGNTIILPFPDGMTYEQALGQHFVVRHYNFDLSDYVEIEATVTPVGLTFVANSFSPYMMLWGELEPEPNPGGNLSLGQIQPYIVKQPETVNASPGGVQSFFVRAQSGDLHYQWQINRNDGKGWLEVQGANQDTYKTNEVTMENDGYQYRCLVSNDVGYVMSEVALLHVSDVRVPVTGGQGNLAIPVLFSLSLAALFVAMLPKRKHNR